MYSIILAIILIAAFIWFNTSKKVKFAKRAPWLDKIVANRNKARTITTLLAVISLCAVVHLQGFGAGIFAWLLYVMGILSLVVLLFPYHYLKYKHVLLIFGLCLVLELTFTYMSSR